MPCLCNLPVDQLARFNPTMSVDVNAVPPQMAQLGDLLGAENAALTASAKASVRADAALAQTLPNTSPEAWLRSMLSGYKLPSKLPVVPGPMLKLALKVSASPVPVQNPARILAELKQLARSLAAQLLPHTATIQSVPRALVNNMTMAARMTLKLRAQGICPMALSSVSASATASASISAQARLKQVIAFSASPPPPPPKLAISAPQMELAATLKAIAPVAKMHEPLGLPPATDPDFAKMLQNQMMALAGVMAPPMPAMPGELLAMAASVESLDTIHAAFGDQALSPQGVAQVNAMLSFVARLSLPVAVSETVALNAALDALPALEDVKLGAQTTKSAAPVLAASLSASAIAVPLDPLLDALTALRAVLSNALDTPLMTGGACAGCKFPLEAA